MICENIDQKETERIVAVAVLVWILSYQIKGVYGRLREFAKKMAEVLHKQTFGYIFAL